MSSYYKIGKITLKCERPEMMCDIEKTFFSNYNDLKSSPEFYTLLERWLTIEKFMERAGFINDNLMGLVHNDFTIQLNNLKNKIFNDQIKKEIIEE